MQKTISKKTEKELTAVARNLGVSREEALTKAVSFFREQIEGVSLREELLAWDAVSGEDFAAFEKRP